MKKRLYRLLSFLLLLGLLPLSAFAAQPAFSFDLAVDGKTEKKVSPGEVITVTLTLNRTDAQETYDMYAMQDEICYDSTFFELVGSSVLTKNGVSANDIALLDHHRAFYMNYLSMSGGELWGGSTLVGTFQLKVIGTGGAARIENRNHLVSNQDGSRSYAATEQDVLVVISDQCTVTFDTKGGSAVASQSVTRGGKVLQPTVPSRPGYRFDGWFRDAECTKAWDFTRDIVETNLHLYAKWTPDDSVPHQRFRDVNPNDWFFADVDYVASRGWMDGVGNGAFAPFQSTNRAMIVTILWRLEGKPASQEALTFEDVAAGQWYTEAIRWAASHGIVTGYSSQSFGPADNITREQMAAILYRYAAYRGYNTSSRADLGVFADCARVSVWAHEALSWANAEGLIRGMTGNVLEPQGQATRGQTAAILHRFCSNLQ